MAACGLPLESDSVYLYRQSAIPAHSEMMWLLANFASFGQLGRMVEFKDKSKKVGEEFISAGLFNYPILMAADILLYRATWVPVGEDPKTTLGILSPPSNQH